MERKLVCTYLLLVISIVSCHTYRLPKKPPISQMFIGNFTDDYSIRYIITDSLFMQLPNNRYHIIKWNATEKYILAKNHSWNISDKDLYTRIDYMEFENMTPYLWGFCYTVYNAPNSKAAEQAMSADRKNPKKGCNGYPFSRMRRVE